MEQNTHIVEYRVEYTESEIHIVGYTQSESTWIGTHIEWETHGVGHRE